MDIRKSRLTYRDILSTLPHLDSDEQFNLLEALSALLKEKLTRRPEKHSLMELEGLGEKIWKKITIDEYIDRERQSWS